jgi:nitrate reductase gamma subunit
MKRAIIVTVVAVTAGAATWLIPGAVPVVVAVLAGAAVRQRRTMSDIVRQCPTTADNMAAIILSAQTLAGEAEDVAKVVDELAAAREAAIAELLTYASVLPDDEMAARADALRSCFAAIKPPDLSSWQGLAADLQTAASSALRCAS